MRALGISVLVLAATVTPLAAQPSPEGWALDGSGTETTLALEADAAATPLPSWLLTKDRAYAQRPRLILSCPKHKLRLGVEVGALAGPITLRFGSEPAFTSRVHQDTKFGSLFSNRRKVVDPHIKYFDKPTKIVVALLRHRRLLLRFTPAGSRTRERTFSLGGLDPLVATFERQCALEEPLPRSAPATEEEAKVAAPVAPKARPSEERFGAWIVNRTTSSIDDRPIVMVSQTAPPLPKPASYGPREGTLVLRCREGALTAFIAFDAALFSRRALEARVRAGGEKQSRWWLSASTDGRAFFVRSAPQLLKRLLLSPELRIRLGPKKRKARDKSIPEGELVFDTTDLAHATAALLEACPVDLSRVKVKDGLGRLK